MAAPNVNGRLHLTGVLQKSAASFTKKVPTAVKLEGGGG